MEQNNELQNGQESQNNENTQSNKFDRSTHTKEYKSFRGKDELSSYKDDILKFYKLTKIDSELADIDEEKGDLPQQIDTINKKIAASRSKTEAYHTQLENINAEVQNVTASNRQFDERRTKYEDLKHSARDNKEYDKMTQESKSAENAIADNIAKLRDLTVQRESTEFDLGKENKTLHDLEKDLAEMQTALEDLNKEYSELSADLVAQRDEIIASLDDQYLELYNRLQRQYRGSATAIVRKGNCTGCYNAIPPQKAMEIRMANSIYTCESCGRILIPEEIAAEAQS